MAQGLESLQVPLPTNSVSSVEAFVELQINIWLPDGLILSGRGSDLQKSLSFYPEIRTRHVEQKSAVFIRTSAKAFPKISPVFIRIEIRHFGGLSGVLVRKTGNFTEITFPQIKVNAPEDCNFSRSIFRNIKVSTGRCWATMESYMPVSIKLIDDQRCIPMVIVGHWWWLLGIVYQWLSVCWLSWMVWWLHWFC